MVLASFMAVATTALLVLAPPHHFQQLHHIGGREKVQAQHVVGPADVTLAISSIFGNEVLEARMASGLAILSSLAKTSFLMSMRSNTASMIRSQSA